MKNILTLFIFLIVGSINAQIINFTDANFKAKLLSANTSNSVAKDSNNNSVVIDLNGNNEIELSEAILIHYLDVSNSFISSLQGVNSFVNLSVLYCQYNNLTSFNISLLINLTELNCSFLQLSNLDLTNNINLYYIDCRNNFLTTLDTSNINYLLFGVNCNNNLLTSLNLKGIPNDFNYGFNSLSYANNPNLEYICIRDNIPALLSYIQEGNFFFGIPNCVVNSYCSFAPGGTYYTIQGNTKYDQANNGCDVSDSNYANLKINLTDGTNSGTVIANGSGNYSLPVSAVTHTLTPVIENPSYFTVSPSTTSVTFPVTASPFTQDFCISPNGVHNDLSVALIPITAARPGFDSQYKIKFKNKGTQTQSGSVSFTFQDAVLDVISSNPSATTSVLNMLTWSFANLQPFETREIIIVLNINSSLETPAVNSGDILSFTSSIVGLTDETPTDNTAEVYQTVVNALDPNDKTCLEGTTISPTKIGDYVHYMIRFENSGTANAQNVVVKDIIDTSKFDVSTLLPIDASHSFTTRISNTNQVEFIFQNINLPFNNATNDGYIVFKIKSKNTLVVSDQISNNANIYFDYNAPIATNTAISTFQTLGNEQFNQEELVQIFPNPAKDILNINTYNNSTISSISIYNTLGQLVMTALAPTNSIAISNLKTGTYFIKVNTDNKIITTKFIKE